MEQDGARGTGRSGGKEGGRWILVAEDNMPLRVEVGELLKRQGWFVALCPDGAAAIRNAVRQDYDAALIDFNLPGIRGGVVAETIRVLNPRACIIGVSFQDRKKEFAAAGADAFLLKPFDIGDVERIVERVKGPAS